MKTLTLIIATGATLALLAPTAGAKNALNCDTTRQAASSSVASTSPHVHQITRNLMYFGTWRPQPASTGCKALQSAKRAAAHAAPSIRFQIDRDSL